MNQQFMMQEYEKQAKMREKWLKMWNEFETEFAQLPQWTQDILLQDISVAFHNRISALKKAENI